MNEHDPHAPIEPPPEETSFPEQLPLLILTNQVVFPMSVTPLRVTEKREVKLIDDAAMKDKMVAILTLKDPEAEESSVDNAYEIGAIARILQLQHVPDGTMNVVIQALKRFKVLGVVRREPYPIVRVMLLEEPDSDGGDRLEVLATTVKSQMARLIQLSPAIPDGAHAVLESITDPGFLADLVASNLSISLPEKQKILRTLDRKKRLERLTYLLGREVELLELSDKIQSDVKSSIDQGQREFYLRQQLKAIQEELGEGQDQNPDIARYAKQIEALELPKEVRREADRELNRLTKMNEASAEYHVITTYLDWIVELPWNTETDDRLDIDMAQQILDEDHYGLERVKRRIVEYLAVRKLKPDATGPILCFVGPPGVGKTSLGKSIARALERKFTRMSLGGMRDEAEIRGHRRTYVGALPGRIIQSIRKARTRNPVFMLDEIDKLGSDFRGDPSSALLEVLDPAQNDSFTDLYLNVPFDLSKVMFIATANMLDTIPWALRDRMEIIEIPGYTTPEKLNIAKKYLVPRQLDAHGLVSKKMSFTVAALRKVIDAYTREAGVRNLEREIANVCRGSARKFAERRRKPIRIDAPDLHEYLGAEKVFHEVAERTRIPGVATGLAWTATGGDILFVEATRMPGKGALVLTGQLGDVMKESAQAVMSYIRANAPLLGLGDEDFSSFDIHIHVPAGAVPKDGPSAGVTILTAVTSLLTGKRVRNNLAMTGEITLRGLVLPVGGVKEKVLAAVRAGVKDIVLPKRCEKDLEEVPDTARKRVRFHFVKQMSEVLRFALGIETEPENGRAKTKAKPKSRKAKRRS
ncbi:MAG: endopeptidase La [bacterium]|nr:endopeptidase La [bacterium]